MPRLQKQTKAGLQWIEEEIQFALATNNRKHLEKIKKELSKLDRMAADFEARIIMAQQEKEAG